MIRRTNLKKYLTQAWHEDVATNSIERWLETCEKEQWKIKTEHLEVLVRIFGASWYFTRFIFVYGENTLEIIDDFNTKDLSRSYFDSFLNPALASHDLETNINQLRILKNACMLKILVGLLNESIGLEEVEKALTELAIVTLMKLIEILQREYHITHFPVTVLGMGRIAGNEMTYGSDLDLIFLYETEDQELFTSLGRTVRLLLRIISQLSSTGVLYEVDMRLRPHGNSGPLVSTYNTFVEYHKGNREIWERQMMTRCQPILVMSKNIETIMNEVRDCIYAKYDIGELRDQIITMRMRVQKELGSPKGKFEIKRGAGGIMDIDFISHFFQLAYGNDYLSLQTRSTRAAILELGKLGLLRAEYTSGLLKAYNYLKRVEMCLRLFDLKSIDSFSNIVDDNVALARAMGHGDKASGFHDEYEQVTAEVRRVFNDLMGLPAC